MDIKIIHKLVVVEEREGHLSARDAMPTDEAADRAKNDPQPGDRWGEMASWWVHIDAREGQRVLTRAYVGPCTVTPKETKEERWHENLEDFAHYLDACAYDGNHLWIAKAGGEYEEPHPLTGKRKQRL